MPILLRSHRIWDSSQRKNLALGRKTQDSLRETTARTEFSGNHVCYIKWTTRKKGCRKTPDFWSLQKKKQKQNHEPVMENKEWRNPQARNSKTRSWEEESDGTVMSQISKAGERNSWHGLIVEGSKAKGPSRDLQPPPQEAELWRTAKMSAQEMHGFSTLTWGQGFSEEQRKPEKPRC